MELKKSMILGIIAALAVSMTVGCNDSKKKKKNSGTPAAEATAAPECGDGEVVVPASKSEQEIAAEQEQQRRIRLNTALASMETIRLDDIQCQPGSFKQIEMIKTDTSSNSALNALSSQSLSMLGARKYSEALRANMLEVKDDACNLKVNQKVASMFRDKLDQVQFRSVDKAAGFQALYDRIEVIVDILEPMSIGSTQAIQAKETADMYAELISRRDALLSEVDGAIEAVAQQEAKMKQRYNCVLKIDDGTRGQNMSCSQLEATRLVKEMESFRKQADNQLESLKSTLSSAQPGEFQIAPAVDSLESLVEKAQGLSSTAGEYMAFVM